MFVFFFVFWILNADALLLLSISTDFMAMVPHKLASHETGRTSLVKQDEMTETIQRLQLLSNAVSPYRNRTHRPGPHRALQHPGLCRLLVPSAVQRRRPPQVCAESSQTGPGHTDSRPVGQTTRCRVASVAPRQAGGVQLRGVTSHHPTNVCCNGSLASGQHR